MNCHCLLIHNKYMYIVVNDNHWNITEINSNI